MTESVFTRKGENVVERPNADEQTFRQRMNEIFRSTDYVFDTPTFILTLVAVIYLLFASITYSQTGDPTELEFSNQVVRILPFVTLGLSFYILILLIRQRESLSVEKPTEFRVLEFTSADVSITIVTVAVGLVSLTFIHNSINQLTAQSVLDVDYLMFYVAIAIAEELAFSMLFQLAFELLLKSWVVGVFARAIGFMAFHLAVYGEQPLLLMLTFLSGLIFALMLKISKRLSANIIVHAIVNAIATGFGFQS